jgi:hypothetical protein
MKGRFYPLKTGFVGDECGELKKGNHLYPIFSLPYVSKTK